MGFMQALSQGQGDSASPMVGVADQCTAQLFHCYQTRMSIDITFLSFLYTKVKSLQQAPRTQNSAVIQTIRLNTVAQLILCRCTA